MIKIQVFDPSLCCSTGVCGVDVDQQLVDFSADVDWAKRNGLTIQRFNLSQQPLAFAAPPRAQSSRGSQRLRLSMRNAMRWSRHCARSRWGGSVC